MIRRTSVAALHEQDWFAELWENTSDALALSDPDGMVLAANPAYYKL
jgi:PAS domain-containing protein